MMFKYSSNSLMFCWNHITRISLSSKNVNYHNIKKNCSQTAGALGSRHYRTKLNKGAFLFSFFPRSLHFS